MYYTLPTIISSIKTISSILFIQMPSKTDVVVFILRLLMWIYHLIFSIWYQFDILTRNCWIDFNAVGFDNVYLYFRFWSAQISFFFLSTDVGFWLALFLVADRCKEIPLRFLFLRGYFFVPSLHLRPMFWLFLHWFFVLSTTWLCLCSFLLPVLFKSWLAVATSFVTSIVNCISSCWGGVGLFLNIIYCMPFPCSYSSTLNGCQPLELLLSVSQANLWVGTCFGFFCFSFFKWNPSSSSKIASHNRSMFLF